MQFLLKLNILLACDPAMLFLGIYAGEVKNLASHNNLSMNVHSSVIYNHPKLDKTQMSFNRWMDRNPGTTCQWNSAQGDQTPDTCSSWIPVGLCRGDEARSKGLPAIYLHVNGILEKAQLFHTAGQWLAGLELGQGCDHKWVSREFGGDGSVLSKPDKNHNSETCTPQKGGFYCMKFLCV